MYWLECWQWIACAISLTGSFFLAMSNRTSRWGFVLFMTANLIWIVCATLTTTWALVAMQCGFVVTSGLGIAKNFFMSENRCMR